MRIEEENKAALRQWLLPKLEAVSDADPSILADYVLALASSDDPEDAIRQSMAAELSDFFHSNASAFIDDAIQAVRTKSYLPKGAPAAPPSAPSTSTLTPSPALNAEASPFNPPSGPSNPTARSQRAPGASNGIPAARDRQSRKRTRESSQTADARDPHHRRGVEGDRPKKQVRRDRRMGMPVAVHQPSVKAHASLPPRPPVPPVLPPGFPAFDPTNPMAAFLSMAAAMSMGGFPSMPPLPTPPYPNGVQRVPKERCQDYDEKGYCVMGTLCPYEHGGEVLMPRNADEYDPDHASLGVDFAPMANSRRRGNRVHAQESRNSDRKRAAFSHAGPVFDPSNTTIVVEQIPEESFSEDNVRGFFLQFGNVTEVHMQAYKRLAIVKYDDHFAARRAYNSPKVIFENRFVKVYWYKSDSLPIPSTNSNGAANRSLSAAAHGKLDYDGDEEMMDPEALAKRQEEAQRAHEERQRKVQETATQLSDVQEQLRTKEAEARKLRKELAQKTGDTTHITNGDDHDEDYFMNDDPGLSTQLEALQAAAQDLGNDAAFGGRGRGGYRGRGGFPPRARGYASFRSGRGRGFARGAFNGARSGVKRLDNRPKRVSVNIEAATAKDEALRQFLLPFEQESIDPHPDKAGTQIITFGERYIAEMFLSEAHNIPDVGKLELAWVPNATIPVSNNKAGAPVTEKPTEADEKADEDERRDEQEEDTGHGDADYDVADDEDRWGAA